MSTRSPCSGVTCRFDRKTKCLEYQSGSPKPSVYRWWPDGDNLLFKMRVLQEAKGFGRTVKPQHLGDRELWAGISMTCDNPLCLNPEHMEVVLKQTAPLPTGEDFDGNFIPCLCQGL
jgi:hypothetical protein